MLVTNAIEYERHRNWYNKAGTSYRNPLCKDSTGKVKWSSEYTLGDGDRNGRMLLMHGTLGGPVIPFLDENIEEFLKVNIQNPAFIQEFIYNGRVENSLKFVYREFSGDFLKPAYTQQVQYDLNQSEVIGFKNLRIKIINASNTEIEYVLMQNF